MSGRRRCQVSPLFGQPRIDAHRAAFHVQAGDFAAAHGKPSRPAVRHSGVGEEVAGHEFENIIEAVVRFILVEIYAGFRLHGKKVFHILILFYRDLKSDSYASRFSFYGGAPWVSVVKTEKWRTAQGLRFF